MRVISLKNYCESTRVVIQLLQYQNKVTMASRVMICTMHNVYFVQYDVPVSFLAQVLDTGTYFVSMVKGSEKAQFRLKHCSGYRVIFWGKSRI